ncbi:MAG: MocR-like pyridoxine biosynthesis transcription factor PdxR [Oryzihumus sp.]
MTTKWAISGRDLHLDLRGPRVRAALEDALRDAVQDGRLPPDAVLPPSRALAADLGIARNTVTEVYGQLVAEGWLTARQGSGTRVAGSIPRTDRQPQRPPRPPRLPYDLRAGHPDVSSFPRAAWLAASRVAINAAPVEAFGYGDPQGLSSLREALAAYLSRARGLRVTPDRVVVCAGFTQGLWLVGSVLQAQGARRIAVESHGHRQHRDLLAHVGLEPQPVPVDDLGAAPEGLEGVDAALLTPAHQFPLGMALDAARREAFLQWAVATGALVIEDDYDGEFRYDRRPVGAMQARAPEQVIYLGTASKTLSPGLRLGWMVLPAHLVDAVAGEQAAVAAQAPVLDQLTFAELIRSGAYDRHVRSSRLAYRRRRDQLVSALARTTPGAAIHGLPAGLHALVSLPHHVEEAAVVRLAADRGLAVDGLSHFEAPGCSHAPALVVGYGTPPQHGYTGALARLTAALGSL